jgi:hypothetical protein
MTMLERVMLRSIVKYLLFVGDPIVRRNDIQVDVALPTSEEVIESLSRYDFRDSLGHPLANCLEFRQLLESIDKTRKNLTLNESEVKKRLNKQDNGG